MPSSDRTPPRRRPPTSTEEPLAEELEQQQVVDLPAREALSIVDPTAFGVGIPLPVGRTADQPPAGADVANSDPSTA